ncbi:MAG: hypothetical protein ABI630_07590 [Betaproteobacteria bacterium]
MTPKPAAPPAESQLKEHNAQSVTALVGLVGVALEPERAASVARTLNAQVRAASPAFAALPFETEPATYLRVSAEESS